MTGQANLWPHQKPHPKRLTASHWDAAATDTQLYFRQHDRQKNRWEARIEIPRHWCPREDLRLQFGGVLLPSENIQASNKQKTYKFIPQKHSQIHVFAPKKKKRTCVTSSETLIKKTSALLSAFRRGRRPCCYLEERLDMRSHLPRRLPAGFVHTAINRRRGTKQPSIWDSCVHGAAGTREDSPELCWDASSARAAVENKNLCLCPAAKWLRDAGR